MDIDKEGGDAEYHAKKVEVCKAVGVLKEAAIWICEARPDDALLHSEPFLNLAEMILQNDVLQVHFVQCQEPMPELTT